MACKSSWASSDWNFRKNDLNNEITKFEVDLSKHVWVNENAFIKFSKYSLILQKKELESNIQNYKKSSNCMTITMVTRSPGARILSRAIVDLIKIDRPLVSQRRGSLNYQRCPANNWNFNRIVRCVGFERVRNANEKKGKREKMKLKKEKKRL